MSFKTYSAYMTEMVQCHTQYDRCTYGIMGVKRTVMTSGMQPLSLNYLETCF